MRAVRPVGTVSGARNAAFEPLIGSGARRPAAARFAVRGGGGQESAKR